MCTKILLLVLWASSVLLPSAALLAATAETETPPLCTIFSTQEGENFVFTQDREGAEYTVISRGRVRERHAGALSAELARALRAKCDEAFPGLRQPAGTALDRDAVVGPAFHYVSIGGRQWAADDPAPAAPMVALLEWIRTHAPALPVMPHAGLYVIGYPVTRNPVGTPMEKDHPAPALAAAIATPFRPVRIADPAGHSRLPHTESEFTLFLTTRGMFEIYYVEGPPFSMERWLSPEK